MLPGLPRPGVSSAEPVQRRRARVRSQGRPNRPQRTGRGMAADHGGGVAGGGEPVRVYQGLWPGTCGGWYRTVSHCSWWQSQQRTVWWPGGTSRSRACSAAIGQSHGYQLIVTWPPRSRWPRGHRANRCSMSRNAVAATSARMPQARVPAASRVPRSVHAGSSPRVCHVAVGSLEISRFAGTAERGHPGIRRRPQALTAARSADPGPARSQPARCGARPGVQPRREDTSRHPSPRTPECAPHHRRLSRRRIRSPGGSGQVRPSPAVPGLCSTRDVPVADRQLPPLTPLQA